MVLETNSRRGRGIFKRKAHEKSRTGCANCKLRSIKCDESWPSCIKCQSFNVHCVYGPKLSSDTLAVETSFKIDFTPPIVRTPPAPLPVSSSYDGSETYQLMPKDVLLIEKFESHIVFTLGSYLSQRNYSEKILPIAFSSPLVMHMVLALAQVHNAALAIFSAAEENAQNSAHWNRAIYLLRSQLSRPIVPLERDALWIAVALHSIVYLAATEANTPAEAWPLRPPTQLDLTWLKLCDGKRLATRLTDPLRSDGAFQLAATEIQTMIDYMNQTASYGPSSELLPYRFHELFELSTDSSINPYYAGVAALVHVLSLQLDEPNFLPLLSWTCVLDQRFKDLLYQKDERAMLLLVYWYAKICDRRIWWMWKQAWTEGLAICAYLEAAWAKNPEMLGLLEWPRIILTIEAGDTNESL